MGRVLHVMVRGLTRVDQIQMLTTAAYNLLRMHTLKVNPSIDGMQGWEIWENEAQNVETGTKAIKNCTM